MARSESQQTITAREYREKYPDHKVWYDSKLAKLMFAEANGLYESDEAARESLRIISGKHGAKNRKYQINKSLVTKEPAPFNVKMPESWAKVKPVFKLPIACNKIGFMADFQSPFHDEKAIIVFVNWLKSKGINTLFLNGDIVDFWGISEYIKDPRQRNFAEERRYHSCIIKMATK